MISEKSAIFRHRAVIYCWYELWVADQFNIPPFVMFSILDENSDGFLFWESLSWAKNSDDMLLVELVDLNVFFRFRYKKNIHNF